MITKTPEVRLFTHTANPLHAIALAIDVWHNPIPSTMGEAYWTERQLIEKFQWLLKQPHQTPLEYFNTVWVFKNVSRAFQQQLTRHRIGFSYSIQSLRVVDVGNFADKGEYHIPSTVKKKEAYHRHMFNIQNSYHELVESGETVEDARGILPLNIYSPITMSCSYRALIGLLRQRLCVAAQEEWRSVAEQMREELAKVHPVLVEPIDCMCKRFANGMGMCKTLHCKVDRKGKVDAAIQFEG